MLSITVHSEVQWALLLPVLLPLPVLLLPLPVVLPLPVEMCLLAHPQTESCQPTAYEPRICGDDTPYGRSESSDSIEKRTLSTTCSHYHDACLTLLCCLLSP